MFTLQNVISKRIKGPDGNWVTADLFLSVEQATQFMEIFSKGCNKKTRMLLQRAIKDNFSHLRSNKSLERIYFDDNGIPCQFCPGQDYHAEILEVRNYIKKFY
jgi:hypothetical protein